MRNKDPLRRRHKLPANLIMPSQFLHPRFWLRHKLLALTTLVALMLLLRLAWGWYVGLTLQHHLARLRANHHPTAAAELPFPQVPAADNAFTIHMQAHKALAAGVNSPSNNDAVDPPLFRPPFSQTWLQAAEISDRMHAPA